MKKLLSLITALLLCCAPALAEELFATVTICDSSRTMVAGMQPVTVTDADGDGALTIADALSCFHAAYHPDGAAAFSAVPSEYGLSLVKLWGEENGGAFGYCVNHMPAMSLQDPIDDGAHITAYAYSDTVAYSDLYCYFDVDGLILPAGTPLTLTLVANSYDANWNPVVVPVVGATLVLQGAETECITNEYGEATITIDQPGEYVISAVSATQTLVPPACFLTVE